MITLLSFLINLFVITPNTPDSIDFNGNDYLIDNVSPLEEYLKSEQGVNYKSLFEVIESGSDCWRGFQASWKIKNDSLLLIRVNTCYSDEDMIKKGIFQNAGINELRNGMFFNQFTGTLIIGKDPTYDILGYLKEYEELKKIEIQKGLIVEITE